MPKRLILLIACGLLGLVVLTLLGRPAYRGYKERRAATHAARYLDKADLRNATISARQALALNKSNVLACQVMAALAERAGAPQVLEWRCRIAELDPSVDNRLHLAAAALKLQSAPWSLAAKTLADLSSQASNHVAFHILSAQLALNRNDPLRAESHLGQAARLEPANPLHTLNTAALRLASTNQTTAAEARATLDALTVDARVAPLALRWLVGDSLKREARAAAQQFSARLIAQSGCTLADRLQHLEILQQIGDADFLTFLQGTQSGAGTNPVAIQSVAAWMAAKGLAHEACRWLNQLPAELRRRHPVPLALAEALAAEGNWIGLQQHLESGDWGDADFLRLAWLSRAAEQLNQQVPAEGNWRLAVLHARDRLDPLSALAALARAWRRDEAREQLLFRIITLSPWQQWAALELHGRYAARGKTRALHKLYSSLLASPAADHTVRNNFAAVSLLLDLETAKASALARDLYAQRPDDPVVVSTYAFSLHLQGHTKDGLAALEKLDAAGLASQSVALYYGLLLAADGQGPKASKYLQAVQEQSLLPEEKAHLQKARQMTLDGGSNKRRNAGDGNFRFRRLGLPGIC